MARMLILIDVNVPDELAEFLRRRGHDVRLSRDELGPTVDDSRIVANAVDMWAVVTTFDNDFSRHAQDALAAGRSKHRSWGLLLIRCRAAQGLPRLREVIDSVEFEYGQALARHPDCLLLNMEIGEHSFTVRR